MSKKLTQLLDELRRIRIAVESMAAAQAKSVHAAEVRELVNRPVRLIADGREIARVVDHGNKRRARRS